MHAEGIKQMGSFQVDIQAWRKSKKRRNDTEVLLSSSSDADLGELGGRELLPSLPEYASSRSAESYVLLVI